MRGRVPWAQNYRLEVDDRELQGEGHLQVGTSHQNVWVAIISLIGKLLPLLYQRLFSQGNTLGWLVQEELNVALVQTVPTCIQRFKHVYIWVTRPHPSKPHETIRSSNRCLYFVIGEGHLISFESRKLNDTECCYIVQENKMTTIIHCLWVWRHYLFGSHFVILTDNVSRSYFQTQTKVSPKQVRWQDFLTEFYYRLE